VRPSADGDVRKDVYVIPLGEEEEYKCKVCIEGEAEAERKMEEEEKRQSERKVSKSKSFAHARVPRLLRNWLANCAFLCSSRLLVHTLRVTRSAARRGAARGRSALPIPSWRRRFRGSFSRRTRS